MWGLSMVGMVRVAGCESLGVVRVRIGAIGVPGAGGWARAACAGVFVV